MTVRYTGDPDRKTVELNVRGHVTRADCDGVLEPLQRFIDTHGRIKVIEVIDSFDGFDPAVLVAGDTL